MSSAICFNMDQSKILSSGNGLTRLTCIEGKRLTIHLFIFVTVYWVVFQKHYLIIDKFIEMENPFLCIIQWNWARVAFNYLACYPVITLCPDTVAIFADFLSVNNLGNRFIPDITTSAERHDCPESLI